MKTVLIVSITIYQKIINPLLHQLLGTKNICRSTPTCSTYSKEVIMKYGVTRGSLLSLRRIMNCQPFFSI